MSHPLRMQYVMELKKAVPDAVIVWDEKNNVWDTGRNAWLVYDKDLPYHTVIQDDAVLCKDFVERLNEALKLGYDAYGHFFCSMNHWQYQQEGSKGKREGKMVRNSLQSGVAVTLSTKLIDDMVSYGDSCKWTKQKFYDRRIGSFLSSRKIDVYYPMPSLADHRDVESLIGSPRGRRAYFFINERKP